MLSIASRSSGTDTISKSDERHVIALNARPCRVAGGLVLARRIADVVDRIGLLAQPWYIAVMPLSSRPEEAPALLRAAILDLGVAVPLERLGPRNVAGLAAYYWPHGLRELRAASWRVAAILQAGNIRAASRALSVTRQSLSKYLNRRLSFPEQGCYEARPTMGIEAG